MPLRFLGGLACPVTYAHFPYFWYRVRFEHAAVVGRFPTVAPLLQLYVGRPQPRLLKKGRAGHALWMPVSAVSH